MAVLNKLEATALCVLLIAVGGWSSASVVRAEAPDCTPALVTLQSCIQYVTGKATAPTASCCSGVLDVHESDPACLCVLSQDDNTTQLIPGYRADLAGQLPTLCKLSGLNPAECPALLGENSTAPALSPGASAPASQYPGAATTSANLRGFLVAYLCIIVASSALISWSKY